MSVLSKLLGQYFRVIPYNCYETIHTWTPSCTRSAFDILLACSKESFKIYSTLYIITTLMKGPKLKDVDYVRLLKDILRSSAFLTSNGFFFINVICLFRHAFGFFILPFIGLTNGLIASFISILIERKSRRGMLALYLTNLASEVAFRMLVNRDIVRPLPNGEVLVFSLVMAGYFFLMKTGRLNSYSSGAIKTVYAIADDEKAMKSQETKFIGIAFRYFPKMFIAMVHKLRQLPLKTRHCQHNYSCLSLSLESFFRNFLLVFSASSALRIVSSVSKLMQSPSTIKSLVFNSKALQLPLFVGLMPFLYHCTSCLLRQFSKQDSATVQTVAGFISGLSMYFYPSVSVAMYLLWKLIETCYFNGVKAGWFPHFPNADILIYTLSTAFVLFAGAVEPHALRPGYWKFLMSLTGTFVGQVNRPVLDIYGLHSSALLKDFKPTLNPLYTTINPKFLS